MSSAFVTNTENAGVEERHWVRGADCEAKELFVKPRKYFRDTANIRRIRCGRGDRSRVIFAGILRNTGNIFKRGDIFHAFEIIFWAPSIFT